MENCFRFLINVDQCLNMSHFDIFFYKLKSQHKFHLNQVQLSGTNGAESLRTAVTDIRMYLDKYPYHVGDCQITVAMRCPFQRVVDRWEDTLLYRLLQINYELMQARIYINSREYVDRALNLVMLYDADFSVDLSELGNYIASSRFREDCTLLLKRIGGTGMTQEQLKEFVEQENCDAVTMDVLKRFCKNRAVSDSALMEYSDIPTDKEIELLISLTPFLKDQLTNFQVFEAVIDRNNRRQNILSLLRVVEFINMPMDREPTLDGATGIMSLAQKSIQNWEKVWADTTLERRYGAMLYRYRSRLSNAVGELELPRYASAPAMNLPEKDLPADNAIESKDRTFTNEDEAKKQERDLKGILEAFRIGGMSVRKAIDQWKAAYASLKQALDHMERKLKNYAEELSRQYAVILEDRKRESTSWKENIYESDESTKVRISELEYVKEELLGELKSPKMTPSLSFQDQLNMENALERANLDIQHLTRCLSAVTAGNFFGLIIGCMAMFVLHYTLLQPYVFQGINSLAYYLIYIGVTLLLVSLTWYLPYRYFRKRLHDCIDELLGDMEKYISGYFEKAKQFARYINLLNRLDFANRHLRFLSRVHLSSHKMSQCYLWHKVQVREHLAKLQFFQGLIELGAESQDIGTAAEQVSFILDGNRVSDVIENPIYWPQN